MLLEKSKREKRKTFKKSPFPSIKSGQVGDFLFTLNLLKWYNEGMIINEAKKIIEENAIAFATIDKIGIKFPEKKLKFLTE